MFSVGLRDREREGDLRELSEMSFLMEAAEEFVEMDKPLNLMEGNKVVATATPFLILDDEDEDGQSQDTEGSKPIQRD
jgi:hypothetical protein